MKRNRKLLVLTILLLGIFLLAGGLFWLTNRPRPAAEPVFANAESIGVWGPARVTLPATEGAPQGYVFSISPQLPFTVIQNRGSVELWFDSPAQAGLTYTLTARPGDEENTLPALEWQFTPRQPDVIYMLLQGGGPDLWVTSLETRQPRQLTFTNGGIQAYAVSPSGEQVVLSVNNSQGGADLWIIDRNGGNMRQLVNCGTAVCTKVNFLPKNGGFAYINNSQSAGGEPVSQIWVYSGEGLEPYKLHEQIGGRVSGLNWSPDGRILAFVDETAMQIQFLFLEKGTVTAAGCQSSETGGWSPDGSKMVFACTSFEQSEPCRDLKEVDPLTMTLTDSPMQELNGQRDYSAPVFSGDGRWVVFGERCFSDRPTRQLWLVDARTQQGAQITDEPLYNFANYHWDPASQMLVLQRYEMGSSAAAPDIMLWRLATEELELLAEGGHSPNWLP